MEYRDELIKIYDECVTKMIEEGTTDEEDKIDLKLMREAIIAGLANEIVSEKDQKFVMDNLNLYRRAITAMLSGDEKGLTLILLEMYKAKIIL